MCNLYSVRTNRAAILARARVMRDIVDNFPPLPGVYPDYTALAVRTAADGLRELAMVRWGMPSPAFVRLGKKTDAGVTNVRNTVLRTGAAGSQRSMRASCPTRRSASQIAS